jgi:plastocyanin
MVGLVVMVCARGPLGAWAGDPTPRSGIAGIVTTERGHGLPDVVITLEPVSGSSEAADGTRPREASGADTGRRPLVINQGGRFAPDLLVVPVGTTVAFRSSDGLFHTAELSDGGKLLAHLGLPADGRDFAYTFTAPSIVTVKDWMNPHRDLAYIVVTEGPHFAVSNGQGHFAIRNVPPGSYTLRAWHRELGSRTSTFRVQLVAGADAQVKLALQEPKLLSMPIE